MSKSFKTNGNQATVDLATLPDVPPVVRTSKQASRVQPARSGAGSHRDAKSPSKNRRRSTVVRPPHTPSPNPIVSSAFRRRFQAGMLIAIQGAFIAFITAMYLRLNNIDPIALFVNGNIRLLPDLVLPETNLGLVGTITALYAAALGVTISSMRESRKAAHRSGFSPFEQLLDWVTNLVVITIVADVLIYLFRSPRLILWQGFELSLNRADLGALLVLGIVFGYYGPQSLALLGRFRRRTLRP